MKRLVAILLVCTFQTANGDAFEDGFKALKRGDYETAFGLLRPLAEQGRADAQNAVGVMYLNGEWVPQDYKEALKWLRKAEISV